MLPTPRFPTTSNHVTRGSKLYHNKIQSTTSQQISTKLQHHQHIHQPINIPNTLNTLPLTLCSQQQAKPLLTAENWCVLQTPWYLDQSIWQRNLRYCTRRWPHRGKRHWHYLPSKIMKLPPFQRIKLLHIPELLWIFNPKRRSKQSQNYSRRKFNKLTLRSYHQNGRPNNSKDDVEQCHQYPRCKIRLLWP